MTTDSLATDRDFEWQAVYDFWFPAGLEAANLDTHWRTLEWWMRGGTNAELPQFAPLIGAAKSRRLNHWLASPRGRLALIVVLDQFPRGLFAVARKLTPTMSRPCSSRRRACKGRREGWEAASAARGCAVSHAFRHGISAVCFVSTSNGTWKRD